MGIPISLFGAKGDGRADDADAFHLAFSAATLCRDMCGLVLGSCNPDCPCPHHVRP